MSLGSCSSLSSSSSTSSLASAANVLLVDKMEDLAVWYWAGVSAVVTAGDVCCCMVSVFVVSDGLRELSSLESISVSVGDGLCLGVIEVLAGI